MTKRKNIMKEFSMHEISIVDSPAQVGAKAVIAKRKYPEDKEKKCDKPKAEKRMALTTAVAGHAHKIIQVAGGPEGLAELRSGQTSLAAGHVHDWVMDDAGNIIIADAEGHSHGLSVLVKADEHSDEDAPAGLDRVSPEAGLAAEEIGNSGEDTMSEQNDAAVENTPAVTQEQLDEAMKRAERAERLAELNDVQKAHYNGLSEEAQNEFLALDADGRDGEVAKAADSDPVVFESEDGEIYRKSDDPRLVKQAKQLEDERKRRRQMEEKAEKADLAKRASDLTIPGELGVKANLLKAVDTLPEADRGPVLEMLKANADRLEKATETLGTSEGGAPVADPIEPIAKRLREANPSLSPEQAYSAALDTPEGLEALLNQRS